MFKNVKRKITREPSQRQLRVAELIRHTIIAAFRAGHFRDPDLQNVSDVTVTSVDVSPDLKNASAYVVPLGGINSEIFIKALTKTSGFLNKKLNRTLELRFTPRVIFKLDNSFDTAQHVNELLIRERKRIVTSDEEDNE